VAPPGNQAATEKTNISLYRSENPVYSPKVGPDFPAETFRILKEKWVRIGSSKTLLANHWDDLERTVHTDANG
jgi:hypothetical protein